VSDWHKLRFISKIEITAPKTRKGGVIASLEEDAETVEWSGGSVITSYDRRIRLTDEVVTFHWDYPDDFKKLVHAMNGDYAKAYEGYLALQKPVPEKWDVKLSNPWYGDDGCNKDGEHDCDC